MAKINLLPWREELRKQQQQAFIVSLSFGALVAVVILGVVYMAIEDEKAYQARRNQMLKTQIAEFDRSLGEIKDIEEKKARLLKKIDVIQKLQASRPEIVHLFDELGKVTPDGVYLTKFTQLATTLTLDGKAESNARVSAFMRAIDNSAWVNSAVLGVIKGQGKNNGEMDDFSMTAKLGKREDTAPGSRK
jgi:type IV pilus assembly protein PilN